LSITTHELLPACQVLFGANAGLGVGFLETLHEDLVKTVFRRRAFETHPDRASHAGLDPLVMTARFQEVNAANELLVRWLATRPDTTDATVSAPPAPPQSARAKSGRASGGAKQKGPDRHTHTRQTEESRTHEAHAHSRREPADTASRARPVAEFFWRGRVPDRQLPLGEYLYYSGRISLQALIAAIHAQRRERPIFGQLAAQRGFLPAGALALLLARKRAGERMGEAALRLGLLTPFQRDVIVGLQRGRQRPFGRFFTDTGALTLAELGEFVRAQRGHNFGRAFRHAS
jgi:hypothetical protein